MGVTPKKISIKQIEKLIELNLGLAVQTLVAGLSADDGEGNPDWPSRIMCAKCLLNKRIPDVQSIKLQGDRENPIEVVLRDYCGKAAK